MTKTVEEVLKKIKGAKKASVPRSWILFRLAVTDTWRVGKTEIITELAKSLQKKLIVERLNGRDPTDLGLPFIVRK